MKIEFSFNNIRPRDLVDILWSKENPTELEKLQMLAFLENKAKIAQEETETPEEEELIIESQEDQVQDESEEWNNNDKKESTKAQPSNHKINHKSGN